MDIEKLKEIHKDLWERAKKEVPPSEQIEYFKLLIQQKRLEDKQQKIKDQLRKDRTRALILLGEALIEHWSKKENFNIEDALKELLPPNGKILARKGKKDFDYTDYIINEYLRKKESKSAAKAENQDT